MADGRGLGTLPTASPFPRFRYWNLVFNFHRPGPLQLFAPRFARRVRFVSLSILTSSTIPKDLNHEIIRY
jgi:hypothetical protein